MPTDQNPKQLVAQRIKDANNILVTVSHDPSVDELSAALALALLLDKLDKATAAVFSGKIPSAIEFLEPGKTFDTNVDGLRDFIIALDKTKADRLRYKVEDDMVRVFITPYKTTITEKDLTFSQGDFNVDLVIAFGVEKREDLDAAIVAHGRILHDAAVVTINQQGGSSSIGEVDWTDATASSLCEMLMSLTESLQSGLIDEPVATALLTGLVSATNRFRNEKTSPKVMTMAAQLMAAGANQQLIAEKLEEANTVVSPVLNPVTPNAAVEPPKLVDGEMRVEHESKKLVSKEDSLKSAADTVAAEESADAVQEAVEELASVEKELELIVPDKSPEDQPQISHAKGGTWRDAPAPAIGGTLNATSEQAAEDKREIEESDTNHVLLSHEPTREPSTGLASAPAVLNATTLEASEPTVADIFAAAPASSHVSDDVQLAQPYDKQASPNSIEADEAALTALLKPSSSAAPILEGLEQSISQQPAPAAGVASIDSARAAVDAAFGIHPLSPATQPAVSTVTQGLGATEHAAEASAQVIPPVLVPPSPALPPLPPLPDFSTLPPLPGEAPAAPVSQAPVFGLPEQLDAVTNQQASASSTDPTQFKLPGQ